MFNVWIFCGQGSGSGPKHPDTYRTISRPHYSLVPVVLPLAFDIKLHCCSGEPWGWTRQSHSLHCGNDQPGPAVRSGRHWRDTGGLIGNNKGFTAYSCFWIILAIKPALPDGYGLWPAIFRMPVPANGAQNPSTGLLKSCIENFCYKCAVLIRVSSN
jgi:hypothetical protein